MTIMPKRCALGCPPNSSITYHHFPHPQRQPDQFKAWVLLTGGKLESPSDYDLYRKKVMCAKHFTEQDKNRNNRLNALAVPTLYLGSNSADLTDLFLPKPIPTTITPVDPSPVRSPTPESAPCLEVETEPLPEVIEEDDRACLNAVKINTEHNYCPKPGKEFEKVTRAPSPSLKALLSRNEKTKDNTRILRHFRAMQNDINNLKSKVTRLRKKNASLKAKNTSLKERLISVKKATDKASYDQFFNKFTEKMTPSAKIFTKMQFEQTEKNPRGRRFSEEEKVLSLSLYQRSPAGYGILSTYFTLPSIKSLRRLEVFPDPASATAQYLTVDDCTPFTMTYPEDIVIRALDEDILEEEENASDGKIKMFLDDETLFAEHNKNT